MILTFSIDSSAIGAGAFETRIQCVLDGVELFMALKDGTPVRFAELATRDIEAIMDAIKARSSDPLAADRWLAHEFHLSQVAQRRVGA